MIGLGCYGWWLVPTAGRESVCTALGLRRAPLSLVRGKLVVGFDGTLHGVAL